VEKTSLCRVGRVVCRFREGSPVSASISGSSSGNGLRACLDAGRGDSPEGPFAGRAQPKAVHAAPASGCPDHHTEGREYRYHSTVLSRLEPRRVTRTGFGSSSRHEAGRWKTRFMGLRILCWPVEVDPGAVGVRPEFQASGDELRRLSDSNRLPVDSPRSRQLQGPRDVVCRPEPADRPEICCRSTTPRPALDRCPPIACESCAGRPILTPATSVSATSTWRGQPTTPSPFPGRNWAHTFTANRSRRRAFRAEGQPVCRHFLCGGRHLPDCNKARPRRAAAMRLGKIPPQCLVRPLGPLFIRGIACRLAGERLMATLLISWRSVRGTDRPAHRRARADDPHASRATRSAVLRRDYKIARRSPVAPRDASGRVTSSMVNSTDMLWEFLVPVRSSPAPAGDCSRRWKQSADEGHYLGSRMEYRLDDSLRTVDSRP
jgi:hypothetical protein